MMRDIDMSVRESIVAFQRECKAAAVACVSPADLELRVAEARMRLGAPADLGVWQIAKWFDDVRRQRRAHVRKTLEAIRERRRPIQVVLTRKQLRRKMARSLA